MAVYEKSGVLNYIDANGNRNILYPVTTTDNVDGLDTELAEKVNTADIVNNLTSADTTKPLSANQGKVLKGLVDGKANSSHTHDGRYYTESEIDSKLSSKVNTTDIINNLTSTDTNKPLSANQGKVLKEYVNTQISGAIGTVINADY